MSNRWKKVLVLLSGYINFVAFAIVGGYIFVKSDNEDLKKTAKLTLILTLIFTGISALLLIYNQFGGMFDGYYSGAAYDVYTIISGIMAIAKVIVFAVFIIIELVKKDDKKEVENKKEATD